MINIIAIAIEGSNNDLPQVIRTHWIVLILLYLNIELQVIQQYSVMRFRTHNNAINHN